MNLKSNNNNKIVYKIAKASLNSSKLKTGFMTLTIALAICFIVVIGLATLNYKTYEREQVKGMQDCMFYEVSEEQINSLKADPDVKCVMMYKRGIERIIGETKLLPIYYDYDLKEIKAYEIVEGTVPSKVNEIVIDKAVLQSLGKESKVGEEVEVLGEIFVVSGLLDNGKNLIYPILLSKEYAKDGKLFENSRTDALIKVSDNMKIPNSAYIKNFFFELGNKYGIERKNVNSNNHFVDSFSINQNEMMAFLGLSVTVLVISGIVIYSIFYLAISSKVKEYAQLRTIGMTKKQMKKMIKIEGLNYCKFGITLGIILGAIIAWFVVRNGYTIINLLKVAVVATFLGILAVYISVSKPAKIASEFSPVEGLRYTGNDENIKASKVLCRSLKPSSLGRIQVSKNRKKTLITLISLSIGGVLFICAIAFSNSMDPMEYTRESNFHNCEYQILLTREVTDGEKNGFYNFIKDENILTNLKNEIEQLEEVEKIKVNKAFSVTLEYKGEVIEDMVAPMTASHTGAMIEGLDSGTGDYATLKANGEAYFIMADVFEEIYGWKPSLGDEVTIHYFNGKDNTIKLKLGGIGNTKFSSANINADNTTVDGWIFLPDNIYEQIVEDLDTTSSLYVTTKNHIYNEELDEKVKDIVRKYDGVEVLTLLEHYEHAKESLFSMGRYIVALSAFIVLFSFINLINTVITSVVSRKMEMAVLQSIGMSKKQIDKMIIFENIYLAIPNCIVSSILGPVLALLVIKIFWKFGIKYMFFHVPITAIIIYVLVSVLIPSVIAIACTKVFNKQSIVDRLREN